MLRLEILNFKVTASFKDQEEIAGNLKAASRWQIMAFLGSPVFLSRGCPVYHAPGHGASWQNGYRQGQRQKCLE